MQSMRKNWDIFCRVIDNYGDIGVCWRLARQLVSEHDVAVRLWVDDLASLQALCPGIDVDCDQQHLAEIDVCRWHAAFPHVLPADVVIEAFACELPAGYLQAMSGCAIAPVWINLEYLSAESWIEGCHALASPHPNLPLVKHFFFPGFTPRSGGLLRERELLSARSVFQKNLPPREGLEISLFCYDSAPLPALLDAWRTDARPIRCRVPAGKPLASMRRLLGGDGPWETGSLRIDPLPFLSQADYDRLLWSCDLNFVRGEDSFLRAQWAAVPFVWQIYPQADDAHLGKLDAFLDRYLDGLAEIDRNATRHFFQAWNGNGSVETAWPEFASSLPRLRAHGMHWAEQLAKQSDLAGNLLNFCAKRL